MQTALLTSAVLTALLGIVHSGLGEMRIIGPLLDPATRAGLLAKSAFVRHILRFAWHLTSVAWWGLAAVLAAYALASPAATERAALTAVAATLAISGLMILTTSRGRHFAWPVFLAAAGLALWPVLG